MAEALEAFTEAQFKSHFPTWASLFPDLQIFHNADGEPTGIGFFCEFQRPSPLICEADLFEARFRTYHLFGHGAFLADAIRIFQIQRLCPSSLTDDKGLLTKSFILRTS